MLYLNDDVMVCSISGETVYHTVKPQFGFVHDFIQKKQIFFFSFLTDTQTATTYVEAENVITESGMNSNIFYVDLWNQ